MSRITSWAYCLSRLAEENLFCTAGNSKAHLWCFKESSRKMRVFRQHMKNIIRHCYIYIYTYYIEVSFSRCHGGPRGWRKSKEGPKLKIHNVTVVAWGWTGNHQATIRMADVDGVQVHRQLVWRLPTDLICLCSSHIVFSVCQAGLRGQGSQTGPQIKLQCFQK